MNKVRIYTDGAYSSERKQGGIGIVVVEETTDGDIIIAEASKGYKNTTNNRMEVRAISVGLKAVVEYIDHVIIISDSMYAIGGSHIGEIKNRRKKNVDLLEDLDRVVSSKERLIGKLEIAWVRGHYEDKYNKRADELAVAASQEFIN